MIKAAAVALAANQKRMGKVEADHADKALPVDLLPLVADEDLERLHHGGADKILHFPERVDRNMKFVHI